MSKYVEFPLEGGGTILIEAPDEQAAKGGSGFVRAGLGDDAAKVAEQAKQSFDTSVENIRKASDLLLTKLRGLSDPPDEMEVSFGLKVSAELGNFAVAKAGSEATYNVTLKWRKDKPEAAKDEKKAA